MGAKTRDHRVYAARPVYAEIPLDQIEPDPAFSRWMIDQDRLGDLTQSLEQLGQVSTITVRRVSGQEKLLIICGERRWLAASRNRRTRTIRCLIFDDLSEADALLMRLTDQLTHEDFQLLEMGEMIARVQALLGWSIRRLARKLCVRLDRIRRPLALLRLPASVQNMVRSGELKQSHAYEISRAPEGEREAIADLVVRNGLTHEKTVALVRRRRAAVGLTSRPLRRWNLKAPGGFNIRVTGPPEARRSDLGQALAAVLSRVLSAKRSRTRADRKALT
jgi:ParB family chromosome partitioning protein